MKEKLPVSVVIAQRPLFEDSEVTMEGIFAMRRGIGYFVQALEDVDKPALAILVDSPNLEEVLLKSVPAYGGGQFSYRHEASITGVIQSSSLAGFSCAISGIRDFVVNMHGEPFTIRLED